MPGIKIALICLNIGLGVGSLSFGAERSPLEEVTTSLVTVSPANELFEAFGHSAILFQKDGRNAVFEYSSPTWQMLSIPKFSVPMLFTLVEGKLPAPIEMGNLRTIRLRYLYRPRVPREIKIDRLNLTPAQVELLYQRLWEASRKQRYLFSSFSNNCATAIRDHIFAVLDTMARSPLERSSKLTRRIIARDSLNEAIRFVGPIQLPKFNIQTGLQRELKTGGELFAYLARIAALAGIAAENPTLARNVVQVSVTEVTYLSTLSSRLRAFLAKGGAIDSILTEYDSIITPKRLRDALSKVQNGGQPLINSQNASLEKSFSR